MVRNFNEITFKRQHGYTSTHDKAMWEVQNEEAALLPIPGRIKVPGTPWIATAEPVPVELMAEVRDALRLEDWSEVWRLIPPTRLAVYVDADVAGSFLEVRTRKPGDRMRPLGMQHEKKMQDIFVDKHVERTDRGSTPIFFTASHCIWLAGVCLDDRARLTFKTQQIVRLAIIKE
jgi:tRNA(Ile)-lysidine synthase